MSILEFKGCLELDPLCTVQVLHFFSFIFFIYVQHVLSGNVILKKNVILKEQNWPDKVILEKQLPQCKK